MDQNCYAVGSTARAFGPSATAGQNPTPVHWYRQTIQFSVNAWVEYSFPSYACMCNTWRIDFVKCATHFYLFMDYNFLSFHFYCLLSSFARNGKEITKLHMHSMPFVLGVILYTLFATYKIEDQQLTRDYLAYQLYRNP